MKFIELEEYGDYSLLLKEDKNGFKCETYPYIVAYKPNKIENNEVIEWAQGYYFKDLFVAIDFIRSKAGYISYFRLDNIALMAIKELIEEAKEEAYLYLKNEMDISEVEAYHFNILRQLYGNE